jgi:hypothetical protein
MAEQAEDEGVRIVVSAPQLAAILEEGSLDEPSTYTNRLWGGLRVVGGTLELVGAGALCLAPEPTMASKAGCVVFGLHGVDTVVAGARQTWTGRDTADLTQTGASKLARTMGADAATSDRIGIAVDIGVPIAMSAWLAAARLTTVYRGRIRLAEHEAHAGSRYGGHTIAKHVSRSEAQLWARLAAEPRVQVASSFRSLSVAEDAISKVLRLESAAVKTWAQTNPTRPLKLERLIGPPSIGTGAVRATGKLEELKRIRVVLVYRPYNGMPYYILTAFPVP